MTHKHLSSVGRPAGEVQMYMMHILIFRRERLQSLPVCSQSDSQSVLSVIQQAAAQQLHCVHQLMIDRLKSEL